MKFSVVTTILNEEESVLPLLSSLVGQELKPDEVIIVDGGSTDETLQLIEAWEREHVNIRVRVIVKYGVNRSRGRNIGIKAAQNEHLAIIDAGCEADKNWLSAFALKWKKNPEADAIAGFYLVSPRSVLEYCFGLMLAVSPKSFNTNTYLPSSRSLAMTKTAWKKAMMYPEYLDTCEDLVFADRLKKRVKMIVTKKALVYWYMPKDLIAFIGTIRGYAEGDVRALYWPHLIKIASVWLRYVVFVVYPPLLMFYLFYPPLKYWRSAWRNGAIFILPAVQLAADVGVMWGSLRGVIKLLSAGSLALSTSEAEV